MTAAWCGLLSALVVVAAAFARSPRSALAHRPGVPGEMRDRLRRSRAGPARGSRRRASAVAAVVTGAAVAVAVWPPLLLGLGGGAVLARRWHRLRVQRSHQAQIVEALPEVIDLVGLASTAGFTVPLTVRTLSQRAPPPFDAAFSSVARRADRGWRLADALAELPSLLGDAVRPLTAALMASERYGVALLPTLEHLAYDARHERRRRAEAAARRLPIRLCFPLVFCILPAFGLLTIAPLLAGALRSLSL